MPMCDRYDCSQIVKNGDIIVYTNVMMAFVLCYELNNVLVHCAISLSCIVSYIRNMRKAQCKRVDGKLRM